MSSLAAMFPFLLGTAFSFKAKEPPHSPRHGLVALFVVLFTIVSLYSKPTPVLMVLGMVQTVLPRPGTSVDSCTDSGIYLGLQPRGRGGTLSIQLRDLSAGTTR